MNWAKGCQFPALILKMYNIKMKLNGENITIGPIDTNEDGLISKGQEITRFDLIKADVVRLFIDTIL